MVMDLHSHSNSLYLYVRFSYLVKISILYNFLQIIFHPRQYKPFSVPDVVLVSVLG